eukprot:jgi/Botrbrau1/11205/Bobra.0075s0001.1
MRTGRKPMPQKIPVKEASHNSPVLIPRSSSREAFGIQHCMRYACLLSILIALPTIEAIRTSHSTEVTDSSSAFRKLLQIPCSLGCGMIANRKPVDPLSGSGTLIKPGAPFAPGQAPAAGPFGGFQMLGPAPAYGTTRAEAVAASSGVNAGGVLIPAWDRMYPPPSTTPVPTAAQYSTSGTTAMMTTPITITVPTATTSANIDITKIVITTP